MLTMFIMCSNREVGQLGISAGASLFVSLKFEYPIPFFLFRCDLISGNDIRINHE